MPNIGHCTTDPWGSQMSGDFLWPRFYCWITAELRLEEIEVRNPMVALASLALRFPQPGRGRLIAGLLAAFAWPALLFTAALAAGFALAAAGF
eukprot:808027-Amphidinium_carterae.1